MFPSINMDVSTVIANHIRADHTMITAQNHIHHRMATEDELASPPPPNSQGRSHTFFVHVAKYSNLCRRAYKHKKASAEGPAEYINMCNGAQINIHKHHKRAWQLGA
uniref:Uncharacterized protein n=1 Tax=Eutreptiella gymnastica TaxID=73025 RepID=A0A7S4FJH9_9EUGL